MSNRDAKADNIQHWQATWTEKYTWYEIKQEKSKLFSQRLKLETDSAVTILSGKLFQISTTGLEKNLHHKQKQILAWLI